MKKSLLFFVFICGFLLDTFSQSNLVSSGGDIKGNNGSVSFSIGQIHYSSAACKEGYISQGLQQPFEILVLGINNPKVILKAMVFPNPVVNSLVLNISDYQLDNLSFALYDFQGKLLKKQNVSNK